VSRLRKAVGVRAEEGDGPMTRKTRLNVENLEDKLTMSVAAPIAIHFPGLIVSTPVHVRAPRVASHPIVAAANHSTVVANGLSMTLMTDQSSYKLGNPVKMTFTETNTGTQAVQIAVGPSIDGFIIKKNGSPIWRSNSGIQPMFLRLQTLQPGQSLTFSATWTATTTGTFTVVHESAPAGPGTTFTVS
jgi:Intracellular proteinase inhibitor